MLDPAVYETLLYGLSPRIRLKPNQSWPAIFASDDAILVTATAGYGDADAVPAPILHAIKLLLSQWYDHRSDAAVDVRGTPTELPNGVMALLANYRRF
jgi:uncharacterized phiE125 gp8 family phage protein